MSYTESMKINDIRAAAGQGLRRGALVKWGRVALLILSDLGAFLTAWLLAAQIFPGKVSNGYFFLYAWPIWLLSGTMIALNAVRGLYRGGNYWRSTWDLFISVGLSFLLIQLFWFVTTEGPPPFSRLVFAGAWFLSVGLASLGRTFLKQAILRLRRAHQFCVPTFVIGAPERRSQMIRMLSAGGYTVVGEANPTEAVISGLLGEVLASDAQEVVISTLDYLPGLPAFYRGLHAEGITTRWVPDSGELLLHQVGTTRILCGMPTVEVCPPLFGGLDFRLKRIIDIVLSGVALLVTAPIAIAIATAIRLNSPGPVFFVQERIGVRGKPFKMFKFRSMFVDAEARKAELLAQNEVEGPLFKLRNDPRITKVGQFLRKSSLDEMPQLWNVLIGEMSLVGPRPPVASEVALYKNWHYDRLLVIPGITGLWQISGRSDLKDFDDVVRLDLYYIQNWSLALDIDIMLKTVGVVLRGKGAY
jgi:exopolysaccharide biosynthesis polyprenyl glycosylphosphotransferase